MYIKFKTIVNKIKFMYELINGLKYKHYIKKRIFIGEIEYI